MAKKKKRSGGKDKQTGYITELYGIVLVLISILGIGKYGPVGRVISSFGLFLVGSLYFFLLLFILGIGIYIIVKRQIPNLFSSKLLGIYLIVIGVLVFLHQNYANLPSNYVAICQLFQT